LKFIYRTKNKKDLSKSQGLFKWGARWDCLGFFALNVSACFAVVIYITWQKHSALCKKSARTQTKLCLVGFSSHTQIKNAPIKGAYFYYGASNGIRLEPYCVEFLHLCLHDEDTIEQIKKFIT